MGSVGSSRGHDLDKVPRFYLQQVDIGRSRGTLHYCLASQAKPSSPRAVISHQADRARGTGDGSGLRAADLAAESSGKGALTRAPIRDRRAQNPG